jgi:hypothetical protein
MYPGGKKNLADHFHASLCWCSTSDLKTKQCTMWYRPTHRGYHAATHLLIFQKGGQSKAMQMLPFTLLHVVARDPVMFSKTITSTRLQEHVLHTTAKTCLQTQFMQVSYVSSPAANYLEQRAFEPSRGGRRYVMQRHLCQ